MIVRLMMHNKPWANVLRWYVCNANLREQIFTCKYNNTQQVLGMCVARTRVKTKMNSMKLIWKRWNSARNIHHCYEMKEKQNSADLASSSCDSPLRPAYLVLSICIYMWACGHTWYYKVMSTWTNWFIYICVFVGFCFFICFLLLTIFSFLFGLIQLLLFLKHSHVSCVYCVVECIYTTTCSTFFICFEADIITSL